MAQKPTPNNVRSSGSQRDNRYPDTFRDQHKHRLFPMGRPWTGQRERAANQGDSDGFTGTDLQPGDHLDPFNTTWHAPFMPSVEYFKFDYQYKTIYIMYDKLFGHDVAAYDNYYAAAAAIAHNQDKDPVEYGAIPRGHILSAIGNPPRSPKVAEALMANDPWLLGFTKDVNEELALALGLTRSGYRLHKERSQWEKRVEPMATPEEVLTFTPDRLKELMEQVASQAAAAAIAAEKAKTPSPAELARAERAVKRAAAAETEAAVA